MAGYNRSILRIYEERYDCPEMECETRGFVVGYVANGTISISEHGTAVSAFNSGDIFCLGPGRHKARFARTPERPHEEIVFAYGPDELQREVSNLSVIRHFDTEEPHSAKEEFRNHCGACAPSMIRDFFEAAARCFDSGRGATEEETRFRKSELIMLVMAYGSSEMCRFLLRHTGNDSAVFEQVVYDSIFSRRTLKAIAGMCDRSLSAFKSEFKRRFGSTPHRWFVEQRLNRALVLLKSSSMAISEISSRCMFPNTSHFIKLFRRHYGITPSAYRRSCPGCVGESFCRDATPNKVGVDFCRDAIPNGVGGEVHGM